MTYIPWQFRCSLTRGLTVLNCLFYRKNGKLTITAKRKATDSGRKERHEKRRKLVQLTLMCVSLLAITFLLIILRCIRYIIIRTFCIVNIPKHLTDKDRG